MVREASESVQTAGWSLKAVSGDTELLFDSPEVLSSILPAHHLISSPSVLMVFGVCFYI